MSKFKLMHRTAMPLALLMVVAGLGACTTVEGTNALVDAGTFEREVATETLKGLGMVPRDEKEPIKTPRAPLALPKQTASLPTPSAARTDVLPEDSDKVQIDTSNLTEEDLTRLRNARVVDLRSISGRPLTDVEARQLTARMTAARIAVNTTSGNKPLFLPSDEYFTTVGGQDLICLAENGDLVPLSDPACPEDIRQALSAQ